jgi:DNA-binding response OmpR family regulator
MEEKILIVEDAESLRNHYKTNLSDAGYAIDTAPSGKAAMEKLSRSLIDLVVLDLDIERGSGLDYLQQFVQISREAKVVVVSETSWYKSDFHSWAADAYLMKSPDLTELKSTIDLMLHRNK